MLLHAIFFVFQSMNCVPNELVFSRTFGELQLPKAIEPYQFA